MTALRRFAALSILALCVPACQAASISDFLYRTHRTVYDTLVYRLFVPAGYNPATRYPIILTFHGVGESGNNNTSQLNNNVVTPWIADTLQARHPCFIVSPQCPSGEQWADFPWSAGIY
jgi:predicted peptidase